MTKKNKDYKSIKIRKSTHERLSNMAKANKLSVIDTVDLLFDIFDEIK